jgi:predicted MPP superfamily phosphohydrolase
MFRAIYSIQWLFNHLSILTAIFSLALLAISFAIFQKKWSRWLWLFVLPCLALSSITWYGSTIEIYNLQTNYTTIKTGFKSKFVLISDTHLGVWKDQTWSQKVVDRINQESQESNIQAVLIAGDLTYEAEIGQLKDLFTPFKNSKVSVYAALGDHDIEVPGRNYKPDIFDVLESSGIQVLENRKTKLFKVGNQLLSDKKIKPEIAFDSKDYIWLIGLADFWDKKTTIDLSILDDLQESDKVFAIAHNPDTVDIYKDKKNRFDAFRSYTMWSG